ncbi:MAG TPA: DUF1800 domain-containing protein [Chloroflexota bacterium]|nr:DUF1800 domain-containing protein [Chloroflexota bacterium]
MRRASVLRLTLALQAALLGAACTFDPAKPHPLKTRRTQVAHLLRRAGFGASKEMLDEYEALGLTGAVDRLVDYETVEDEVEERIKPFNLDLKKLGDLQRWWLLRMIYTKRPLQEKMVLFWHGLLTSATGKVGLPNPTPQNPDPPHYMLDQHNFFRQHATADFETMLLGISRDPAMMIWLDSQTNNKGKPNENYARELLELFSLGITGSDGRPNYTEQDVREVARAFTGWGLDKGKFIFRLNNHDTGLKTILGKTASFNGADVVKHLVQQPAAAYYLSRRLFEFFVHPHPSQKDLQPLVTAYTRSKGDVKAMLRALFTSPAFYSPAAYRSKIKSPVEFVVGAIRNLGVATDGFQMAGYTTRMGQALFNPPNVAGWPGGANWITSTTWMERINFCNFLVTARTDGHTTSPPFEAITRREGLSRPEAIVDYFGDVLLDGQIAPKMRQTLLAYLTDKPVEAVPLAKGMAAIAGKGLASAPQAKPLLPAYVDQKVRGLAYLLLASPEYQLA